MPAAPDSEIDTTVSPTAEPYEEFTYDDATWVLTAAIVIFTMQTGFGLLESGCVSQKNEVNILMKNAADVILGGLTYWLFGFGLQHGTGSSPDNDFSAVGRFMVDAETDDMGLVFSSFIFQLSFSTTATTIVSGAMAERANYNAYCVFSLLNTIVYCIPAGWVWGDHGFLKKMGAIDFAGSGCVHLLGGASALVAAVLLGPRRGRFGDAKDDRVQQMSRPTNVLLGTFTLWWGWLVFNCGSSFGVRHDKWKYASRAAVTTINASLGGGIVGVFYSYFMTRKFLVDDIVNAILTALVAVTAGSGFYSAYESIVVGVTGALFACWVPAALERLRIDDPVGAVAVHGVGGIWGLLAVGLFADADSLLRLTSGRSGLFKGGGAYLLGVQALSGLCIAAWSVVTSYVLLKGINYVLPIRMTELEEALGADLMEHNLSYPDYDYDAVLARFQSRGVDVSHVPPISHRGRLDRRIFDEYLLGTRGRDAPRPEGRLAAYVTNYVREMPRRFGTRTCTVI
ncbi:putative ammonium transporter 3 [Rhipicephalus microplus]|uniref:putative ammonium transporter 3 n=1 Tax=Rhipicephalus microplus TaxID=6941 RepID=UPI003F6CD545